MSSYLHAQGPQRHRPLKGAMLRVFRAAATCSIVLLSASAGSYRTSAATTLRTPLLHEYQQAPELRSLHATAFRRALSLRGGGGVFEGQLRRSAAVGEVSTTLAARGTIGANCGEPANVPTDITCNQHQDSLLPSSVFALPSDPSAAGDIPDADLNVPEWKQQARNYVRAHVERGAAMVAHGSGAALLKVRAILNKFDTDKDGFLQRGDMQRLLEATNAAESDEVPQLDEEVWGDILASAECSEEQGLDVRGLLAVYTSEGEDLDGDYQRLFGEGTDAHPTYPPCLDTFPDPVPPPPELEGSGNPLRRWMFEDGYVAPGTDVWGHKLMEECAPQEGGVWYDRDWGEFDYRLVRNFLFEQSLEADVKQRVGVGGDEESEEEGEEEGAEADGEKEEECSNSTGGGASGEQEGVEDEAAATEASRRRELQRRPSVATWMGPLLRKEEAAEDREEGEEAEEEEEAGAEEEEEEDEEEEEEEEEVEAEGEEEGEDPPLLYGGDTGVAWMPDPPTLCGQTWNEWLGEQEGGLPHVAVESLVGPCDGIPLPQGAALPSAPDPEREVELRDGELRWVRNGSKVEGELVEGLNFAGVPRHQLALAFSRGLRGVRPVRVPADEGGGNGTTGEEAGEGEEEEDSVGWRGRMELRDAEEARTDIFEPMEFNADGMPWVYDRPEDSPPLFIMGRQDPWDPQSAPVMSETEARGGWMERLGLTAGARENRRKAFKLLMVGPDGGGKSSLLFCWKSNQALGNSGLEVIPTVLDWNMEEVAFKDLIFTVWDQGGPDPLRAFYAPTPDPSTVDAIVFVVDAPRMRKSAQYREAARKELWRYLEGDIYNTEVFAAERALREALEEAAAGEGNGTEPLGQVTWKSPPGFLRQDTGPALDKDGNLALEPTDTGLWLRHVTKVLILANKCEQRDRATMEEVRAALRLDEVRQTHLADKEDGGSPLVVMPDTVEVRREWHLQAVSAWTGHGVLDGLEWLYNKLEGHPVRSG